MSKDREHSARWQPAAELLLAEVDVGALTKQVKLALFFEAKLESYGNGITIEHVAQ
jgi:hypothetical protein